MGSNPLRIDPVGSFNFYVTLIDNSSVDATLITGSIDYSIPGFSECTGLDASVEIMDYREGGVNDYVHRFATRATYSNLILKHGVISLDDDLWSWHYDWVQGLGTRKDGLVVLLDSTQAAAKIWRFKRGIPTKWVGPTLNATQSTVAIESLEISHEGLDMELGA
ncbi:phage tail protein [Tunturibacter psychrotolerans]|uniref:Phage tail protein n=1 Tax=Tunturiibacter psychrotolerans TaxID=3069686 RepID=A0AAU7ZRN8_9BACT